MNPSGGLACFGEAIPAQAIAQVCEVTWQLRGQAGGRQVEGATVGVTANQGLFGHGSSVIVSNVDDATIANRRTDDHGRGVHRRSGPHARSGGAAAGCHRSTRPTSARTRIKRARSSAPAIDPGAVDDVIFGNVDSIGPQAGDIARTCWLVAGLPEHVPGTTVDRQCGSAQQAIHFAAQGVMSGTADLIVAGGVQNMSQIPIMTRDARRACRSGTRRRSRSRRAGRRATATRRCRSSAAPS